MRSLYLKLPATSEQLQSALTRIGVSGGEQGKDFFITYRETQIAGLTRDLVQNADINELNYMAAKLSTLAAPEIDKLNAAAKTRFAFDSITQFIDYADNHDFFTFIPNVTNAAELGDYYLNRSEMVQMPEEWKSAVNVEVMGALAAANEHGEFSKRGYIMESGDDWRGAYNKDIPQEYRLTTKQENIIEDAIGATVPAVAVPSAKPIPIVLTSENPREKLKEITARLEQGVKNIFNSDNFKAYLQTLSKFHNYSLNNTLLIAFQNPEATQIAGFSDWRNKFGRQVLKGEKGIKIIAPSPFKTTKRMEVIDPQTQKSTMKDVEVTVPAFKVVSVFDVSQTEGREIPTISVNELTGSVERYNDFFAALEKVSPVPIAFENIETNAKGYYHFGNDGKRIAIREGMSELQTLKTTVHEICHARLHDVDLNTKNGEKTRTDKNSREVEAESVAYVVCQHYGLDTSDYSFAYAAKWSGDKEIDVLKASLETIRNTANDIITDIDKHFTALEKDRAQTVEQQPGHEQWGEPATAANAPSNPGVPSDDINAYLPTQGDTFSIYQLKDGDTTHGYRFESLDHLQAAGLAVERGNYEQTYTAPLSATDTPDSLFQKFNIDRPQDFTGHSLSTSDIIVVNHGGNETALYIDVAGFQDVSQAFLNPAPGMVQTAPTFDVGKAADYVQKLHDGVMNADPNKTMGVAAYNAGINRLEKLSERVGDTNPMLKALIDHTAESTDLSMLKDRIGTVNNEFQQLAAPPTVQSVAEFETRAKRGEQINVSALAAAIKAEKPEQKPTAARQPRQSSIHNDLKRGAAQLAKRRAATPKPKTKNNDLEV
ncbi:hypothetical protein FACS1894202_09590 [Clostridia bacterium]|nr:hypothetical protein FACS1894202_09590 [Clostridia bacterium]